MRKFIIIFCIVITTAYFVRGWVAGVGLPHPPVRSMVDAYYLATQALGTGTNGFYCVSARLDREWRHVGAWVFTFDSSDVVHKFVYVAMEPNSRDGKPGPQTEIQLVDDMSQTTNNIPSK